MGTANIPTYVSLLYLLCNCRENPYCESLQRRKKTTSGNHKYLYSKNLVHKLQILHIYEATSFQSQNLPLSFYEHEKLQMFWNQIDYVIILFFPQDIPVNESKMKVINFCLLQPNMLLS